jgi:iron complex outermembrane receptor protein
MPAEEIGDARPPASQHPERASFSSQADSIEIGSTGVHLFFRLFLTTCVAVLPLTAAAAEIHGSLIDANSRQPIAGAEIRATATGLDLNTTTDAGGTFVLRVPEPPPSSLDLRVEARGYQRIVAEITDFAHTTDLTLEAHPLFAAEVEVTGLRAEPGETPVTVTNVGREEIERRYWAQDVPVFLSPVPGFYAYNDSGNGIGYSYFFLRGFDMRRTAVSLNGVPLNDAHSHGLFFIDLADFLSTTDTIQVQRGVGTNLYGGSAIGGSIDVQTSQPAAERRLRLVTLGGSFGTSRLTLAYDTGLVDDRWAATFRYSKVSSDGYRDQSWAEMWNYYASVVRYGAKTTLHINLFGGPEKTHLAYEGIPRAFLDGDITGDVRNDRRYNPLEYPNEIDQFFQPHYQVIHSWQVNEKLVFQNTFFYFAGDGNFQQFKSDRWFPEYGLDPFPGPGGDLIDTTDLVRRREVDEWDGGWIPNIEWRHGNGRGVLQAGAAIRLHSGRHFGVVQWAQYYPPDLQPDHRYYDYQLDKTTVQPFLQESWRFSEKWNLLAGLTWTSHSYDLHDDTINDVDFNIDYSYLLPRLGISYHPTPHWSLYTNISRGGREPAFRDIYDPQSYWTPPPQDLDPEELTDFELGGIYRWTTGSATLNFYFLDFSNAIVWAGGLDNNGDPVTANGAVTEHAGVELDLNWAPRARWSGRLSVARADNTIVEFVEYGWDGGEIDHSGNSLPVSPEWMGTLELRGGTGPVDGFLQFRFVDSFYLDNSQDMRKFPDIAGDPDYIHRVNPAYAVLDLGLDVDLGQAVADVISAKRVSLQVRANNLADRLYTTFGYFDGVQPVWIPAATRNGYVGLTFDW